MCKKGSIYTHSSGCCCCLTSSMPTTYYCNIIALFNHKMNVTQHTTVTYRSDTMYRGREWIDWLPIHDMLHFDVFATILSAGQRPHWAYYAGMTRLSCVFCIMASAGDLTTAARLMRDLYRRYVETEKRLGHTLSMTGRSLEEITGVAA